MEPPRLAAVTIQTEHASINLSGQIALPVLLPISTGSLSP
jgi:hypothetical protein